MIHDVATFAKLYPVRFPVPAHATDDGEITRWVYDYNKGSPHKAFQ